MKTSSFFLFFSACYFFSTNMSISSSSISYSSREQRASTNSRHRTRFVASALTSVHVFPAFLASSTTVRLHVVFGRPLFRVPCGFQSSAFLAISPAGRLTVWPIHFHFRRLIITFIGSHFVVLHSSSLLMTFGQNILRMRLRHLLTKTWILFTIVDVIFQVSQPYSNTETTFVLKNRNFKFLVSCVEFHTLFSEIKAWRAFCIRLCTSRSAPPSLVKTLPR